MLLNNKYIVPSHNYCHVSLWHSLSIHKLKEYPWWEGYLERLKELSIEEYERTINKFNK